MSGDLRAWDKPDFSFVFSLFSSYFPGPGGGGLSGFCSLALFHEGLFRDSFQLAIVGPMANVTAVYVAVIVKTEDRQALTVVSGEGVAQPSGVCQRVRGNKKLNINPVNSSIIFTLLYPLV